MTNAEARDIVWDFQNTFLKDLEGEYYDKVREALSLLWDTSKLYDLDQWQETERD